MYNVVLFTDVSDNITASLPIGAYKLAHVLRKQGYSCLVVNHFGDFSLDEFKQLFELAISDATVLVGFSNTFLKDTQVAREPGKLTPSYPNIAPNTVFPQGRNFEKSFFEHLRKHAPWIKTVVGGAKVSMDYSNKNVDYVCMGFSEVSIVNLVDHLTKKVDLQKSSRNIWGRTIIDDRTADSYNFQHEDMQWTKLDIVNHRVLPLEIARGCIFKCKFCAYPMNGKQMLDFVKCEHNLQRELEQNYEQFGIYQYHIIDDTFNDHQAKLERILSVVKRLKFQPVFWAFSRLDLICTRPDTLDLLYDMGIRSMFFGIETMHQPSGRIIGKGFSRSKQISMIQKIRSRYGNDLSLHGSFIVGVPEEPESSVVKTFDQILSQEIPLHSWYFNAMNIGKKNLQTYHSEIENNFEKYGYTDLGSEHLPVINWKSDYMTYDRAKELRNNFMAESYQSNNLYMTGQFALGVGSMGNPNFGFDKVRKTLFKTMDFNKVETVVRPSFISEYKQQLFDLLQVQHNE